MTRLEAPAPAQAVPGETGARKQVWLGDLGGNLGGATGKDGRGARFREWLTRFRSIRWLVAPGEHRDWVKPGVTPPVPSFDIATESRIDVLIAVHNAVRDSIHRWEDRLYQGSLTSSGAILLALGFFLQHPNLAAHRIAVAGALLLFGGLGGIYLVLAARASAENGAFLTKIEAAMGLCEPNAYLVGCRFVGYSGQWMRNWRAIPLLVAHMMITFFCVAVVLAFPTLAPLL
ncbi:MAG TPA: hypothetical protein VF615_11180 [Longimicrobiaceae bacterium]